MHSAAWCPEHKVGTPTSGYVAVTELKHDTLHVAR